MELMAVLNRLDLFLLLFARATGLLQSAPPFSSRYVPATMRVILAAALTLVLMPVVQAPVTAVSLVALALPLAGELLVGLAMGYVMRLFFAAVDLGGEILDIDMGFALAHSFDPTTEVAAPLVGQLQNLLAMLLFFATNAHHLVVTSVVTSYRLVPPGAGFLDGRGVRAVDHLFGGLFITALGLVAPVMVTLLLTNLALGLASRAMPNLNLIALGQPIKAVLGLLIILVALPLYIVGLQRAYGAMTRDMIQLLPLLKG